QRVTTKALNFKFMNPGGTMGEHNVSTEHDSRQSQAFMKSLLADVSALERMIEAGRIESGVRGLSAGQERVFINFAKRPGPGGVGKKGRGWGGEEGERDVGGEEV